MTDGPQGSNPSRPRRRPRYPGTHPRRFEQRYKELDPQAYPGIHEHVRAQGRTPAGTHVAVLLAEVLDCLAPRPGEVAVDCTVGHGGHAWEILQRISPGGRLIGLDVDAEQLAGTGRRLGWPVWRESDGAGLPAGGARLHRSHFAGIAKVLAREGLAAADLILADLGVSSMQIDDPRRGFSYKYDGPLDMRMDDRLPHTAADLLASLSGAELSAALRALADEPAHERIARAIVQCRERMPIKTTRQLTRIVLSAMPEQARKQRKSAARTFQALRMLVNDELGGLAQWLRVAPYCLRPGGRLAVITFHSGEQGCVEQALADGLRDGIFAAATTQPIRPAPHEIAENPRSRSARLYWARTPS